MSFIQIDYRFFSKTVISVKERMRNHFIETDLSSPYLNIRIDMSSCVKGELKSGNFLLANPIQKGNRFETGNLKYMSIVIFFFLIGFAGLSQNVNRVISLAPSITENLYLIGAQNKLVGCTSFCTQAIADGKAQVGSTIDVNIEKILSLKPDLVLAMLLTKPQDIETMRRLGIKVEIFPSPKNFDEICLQTLEIAKMTGNEKEANSIVLKTKHEVDSLKLSCRKHTEKQKIFFQLGANPIFTVLENIFMNDYILFCNAENIFSDLKKGSVTRESVIKKNPDLIIIATMGGFVVVEKKTWESYTALKAAKNNKIFLIDSETSCSPTPANFVKAFADVVKFINQ